MGNKRTINPKRKINPVYFVFCEGETEEAYSTFLRHKYRVPIQIKTKVTGQKISNNFIQNYIKEIRRGVSSPSDKNYLMYDLDSTEFKERLMSITEVIVLASNPNIELWFLLHYRNQMAQISSHNCRRDLKAINTAYEKGKLNYVLEKVLSDRVQAAAKRAKILNHYENPSSTIYLFTDELISLKKA